MVNADESEPGTCKDIPLMMASPHTLVEGVIIASYAIRATYAFIYVRGEVLHVVRRLQQAVREAYSAGYAGKNILGTGYDLEIVVHAGAGAYICGEETALLDSLEGRRGQPRLRPPFPAVAGLYASPTVINNVESIASVPCIIANGADWFASMGTEKSKGMTIYSLSGHVTNPGQFEAPLGITLRQLLDLAGGIREGHQLKFWTPGGSSTPILTAEHLDVPLDYEGVASVKSMLGTKALQCFDETTSVVRTVLRWTEFYKHESCGKCTPCREGTWWLVQILKRMEAGRGEEGDIEKLLDLCENILGRSFCALGDGATSPISSAITVLPGRVRGRHAHPGLGALPVRAQHDLRPRGGLRMTAVMVALRARGPELRAFSLVRRDRGRHGSATDERACRSRSLPAPRGSAHDRDLHSRAELAKREDLVTLTIDDVEVSVPKGTLVIRAAELIGIEIPRFCDHPLLDPVGACRQCLVEVPDAGNGRPIPKPQASCTLEVARRHGGQDPGHLAGRRQGPAREHGVPADQPPAGLPDLRQGRRVPAAEPGDVARLRREPVHRRQADLPEADQHLGQRAAGPRALRALRPLHPVLRAGRR